MRIRMTYIATVVIGAGVLVSAGSMKNGEMTVYAAETQSLQSDMLETSLEDGEVIESVQVNQITYTLYESGRMYISGTGTANVGYINEENRGKVKEMIFQNGITKIENSGNIGMDENGEWFYYYKNLEKVIFPEGLKEIANGAFAGTAIEEVSLPEGITQINSYTFAECKNLTDVSLPTSLREIKHAAFSKCTNLKKIVIPEGVEKLGEEENTVEGVFYQCTNLSEVTLPETLKFIGCDAFSECTNLSQIEIPDSVTYIADDAFSISGIVDIKLSKNITEINGGTFYWCTKLKKIEIPEGVTRIGSRAFYASSLEEVSIPDSVTSIEFDAFECNLKSLELPRGLQKIGRNAFVGNTLLEEVIMNGDAPKCEEGGMFEDGPFSECSKNLTIYVPENSKGYNVKPWINYNIVYQMSYELGDINQDDKVNMKDARTALKAAVGSETLSEEQKKLGDVDNDGKVGMKDARLILKYAVGSITEF